MASSEDCFCCDPYARHKKPINKNLRIITETDLLKNPNLTLGLFWCDNCRKCPIPVPVAEVQLECCNPFKIHSRPIHKGLREIRESDKKRFPFVLIGSYWCDTCRKISPVQSAEPEPSGSQPETGSQELAGSSQSSGTTGSPSHSPAVQAEAARRALTEMGLSPMVTEGLKTKAAAVNEAKRKLNEATATVQKKVCRALGLAEEDVVTDDARKARDHDLLMEDIKKQLPSAGRTRKYQLLSLVPASMSEREAAEYFNVSRRLFARVRKLTAEKGILPVPSFSKSTSVLESTRELIAQFYCSDEYSKIMPGKRYCVSIKRGVFEQKRLLLINLPELFEAFKTENENLKVGLTVFSSLKPKWCISAGQAGTHEQCVCQIHQNFKLILFALNIKTHYRQLIEFCVCNVLSRSCMLRICEACPTLQEIKNILRSVIPRPQLPEPESDESEDDYEFFDEPVKYRQWKSTDRTEMIVQLASRADLIEVAAKQIVDLITHDFIARSQQEYIKKSKEELTCKKALIGMDFAMNYNCLIQGAVQSYHWSPKQATVFPTVIYFRNADNQIQQKSLIFISDDLDHDVPLVQFIQEKTIAYVKESLPYIEEVEFITDGCSAQFKSKGYFKSLCTQNTMEMKVTHSHFATSHGKSQCDADGGTVKRTARRASLQRPLDKQIVNAKDLFEFCINEMKNKFQFFFVSNTEVDPYRKLHLERMLTLETLPGTRTFHHFHPLSDDTIAAWRVSSDKIHEPALVHKLTKTRAREVEQVCVRSGMNIVVRFAKYRYVCLVTDIYNEEAEVDVSLLMPKLPAKEFHWPRETKSATIPIPHVLCEVTLSEEDEKIVFTAEDLQKLYDMRVLKRPR